MYRRNIKEASSYMQNEFFAASNSAHGFKNYYPEVFAPCDVLYIIKGGPGTGKSTFMKKYGRLAESEGAKVEYYYCSSDPSSLDGVLIFGRERIVGIIDGTAPHVSEPELPGVREEIVNLGACWDGELLRKQKNEIVALCDRKSAEYKSAYRFLRSVGNLRAVSDGLVNETLDREKMKSAISRIIKDIPVGKAKIRTSIVDSVSMSGRVRFTSLEDSAEKLYIVSEYYGVGEMFLDELYSSLGEREVKIRVSFDPICPEHVDGILLEDEKIAFVTGAGLEEKYEAATASEDGEETADGGRAVEVINSKRFVDMEKLRQVRNELRYTFRLAQSSLDGALHSLSKARIYHFLLEDIYGKAMDWKKTETIKINL